MSLYFVKHQEPGGMANALQHGYEYAQFLWFRATTLAWRGLGLGWPVSEAAHAHSGVTKVEGISFHARTLYFHVLSISTMFATNTETIKNCLSDL